MSKTINIGGDTFEILDVNDVSVYPRFVIRIGDNLYAVSASYFDASGNVIKTKKTYNRPNSYIPKYDKVTYTGFKTKSGKRITIASYQASDGRLSLPPDSSNYMKQNYPDSFDKMTELPQEIAFADWSNVVNADGFFDDCTKLKSINGMFGFKGESISFRHCGAYHIPIINGQNLTSFSAQGCSNLEEIHFINFTEPKANIMNNAPFNGCANMKKLLGFNFRNQDMNTGDALYYFSVQNNLRNLTIDCTNIDTFGKTPCINVAELGLDSAGGWKFTLINVPTKFKGNEKDLIDVTGRFADGTTTNTYHIVNFLDEVVIEAIELTDDRYKMQDLYPARYQTMTEVPDKLDTSKLTTAEEMFNGCKNLSKLPDKLDLTNITNMRNFLYGTKVTTIPDYIWNTKSKTYYYALGLDNGQNLTSLGTSTIDLQYAEDVSGLFAFSSKLVSIPKINLPKVKKMTQLFDGSSQISDFSSITINSDVEDMAIAFNNCTSMTLKGMPKFTNNKINKIKKMRYAFSNCQNLVGVFPYNIDCSNIEDITKANIETITIDSNNYYPNEFPFMNTFKGSGITSVNFTNVDDKYKRYFSKYSVGTDVTIDGTPVDNKINISGDNYSLKGSFGIAELDAITSDFTFGTVNNLSNMFVNQCLTSITLDGLKVVGDIISAYHMFTRCGENASLNPITFNGTIDCSSVNGINATEMFGYYHPKNDTSYYASINNVFSNLPGLSYSKIIDSSGMFAWCKIEKMSSIQDKIGFDMNNPTNEHFILKRAENMFYGTKISNINTTLILDGSGLSGAPISMFDYSNITECKIVNIPHNIDLNSFRNCRNDGEFMNLQVAHDTSTFTTVF